MNDVCRPASDWVQRAALKVVCMIGEGRPSGR